MTQIVHYLAVRPLRTTIYTGRHLNHRQNRRLARLACFLFKIVLGYVINCTSSAFPVRSEVENSLKHSGEISNSIE